MLVGRLTACRRPGGVLATLLVTMATLAAASRPSVSDHGPSNAGKVSASSGYRYTVQSNKYYLELQHS